MLVIPDEGEDVVERDELVDDDPKDEPDLKFDEDEDDELEDGVVIGNGNAAL